MTKAEKLAGVAEAISEKPDLIEIDVDRKWFWQPNKLRFTIKPVKVITMYQIASKAVLIPEQMFVAKGNVIGDLMTLAEGHMDGLCYIIAVGLRNNGEEPTEKFIRLIKNNFTFNDILVVLQIIMKHVNVESFMKSIILIKGMNVLNVPDEVLDADPATLQE